MPSDHRGTSRARSCVDRADPSPAVVASRLATLRALYVPERDVDARARLARERPAEARPLALLVSQRLRELRALCDLARHLHATGPARSNER